MMLTNVEWPGPTMLPKQSTTTVQTSSRGFSTTSAKTMALYMGAMAIEMVIFSQNLFLIDTHCARKGPNLGTF